MRKRGFILNFGLCLGVLVVLAGCQAVPGPGRAAAAAAHPADHTLKPKRLEATVQLNMGEFFFANPQGERNPVVRVPAGKTVGIHIHNDGSVMHELMIGRKVNKETDGYEESLTELVPMDLFFYYGDQKVEVGGAKFEELEVEQGIRDVWLRFKIPNELKGEWEIGCFAEGHYEPGMHTRLIVE